MRIAVDVAIEGGGWDAIPDLDALIGQAVEAARRCSGVTLAGGAELSVMLTDDAAVRDLNRDWRRIDKPTNVLSFPAAGPQPLEERVLLGDLALAWETTEREAHAEGKPLAAHVSHLVVHGFLHLIGYDHETEAEAEDMEGLEVQILATLGVPDPYADTDLAETQTR